LQSSDLNLRLGPTEANTRDRSARLLRRQAENALADRAQNALT